MSLLTDKIFVKALRSNATLMALLPAGDVYNTAITTPDEDLDNEPVPYIIVSFDGLTNDPSTKDDYEGDTDTVNIGIEVAAESRPQLGSIMQTVRETVEDYFDNLPDSDEDWPLVPFGYQLTADPVQYDMIKPCFWQVLHYQCDTNR